MAEGFKSMRDFCDSLRNQTREFPAYSTVNNNNNNNNDRNVVKKEAEKILKCEEPIIEIHCM